jgi:hypothetical protein
MKSEKEEKIFLKIKGDYTNQFLTTIKGNVFYKDKVTEYVGEDNEVEQLLSQGLLVVVENPTEEVFKQNIQKNDMNITKEEYKEFLKEDKRKAVAETLKQFEDAGLDTKPLTKNRISKIND